LSVSPHEAILREATFALERSESERERLIRQRDNAIREAHHSGMTIRAIADLVGLHASRVGQIVNEDPASKSS
jgi:hypothetical protein